MDFIKHKLSDFTKQREIVKNSGIIFKTDLTHSFRLSQKQKCNVWLKREDTQSVRSFKIRGAQCKVKKEFEQCPDPSNLVVVTASAGNHAQGVALACQKLNIKNVIFCPENTPNLKLKRITHHAGAESDSRFELKLHSTVFDDTLAQALQFCASNPNAIFVHPYDDLDVIMGQSTVAQEVYEQIAAPDYILCSVGGGGLISGVGSYSKLVHPGCEVVGVEPINANGLQISLGNQARTTVDEGRFDTFVDGASVKTVGQLNFAICSQMVDQVQGVCNGAVCSEMLDIQENEGVITEPAGALPLAGLAQLASHTDLRGKDIVLVMSGSNNDVTRYAQISQLATTFRVMHQNNPQLSLKNGDTKVSLTKDLFVHTTNKMVKRL